MEVTSYNPLHVCSSQEQSGLETQLCESSANRKATKEGAIFLGIDDKREKKIYSNCMVLG